MVAAVMAVAWAVVHMAGGHRRRGVLLNVDTVACLECRRPKGRASHVVGGFWCSTASVSCATSCKNWNLGARPFLKGWFLVELQLKVTFQSTAGWNAGVWGRVAGR